MITHTNGMASQPSKSPFTSTHINPYNHQVYEAEGNMTIKDSNVGRNLQFPVTYTNVSQLPTTRGFTFGEQAPTLNHYLSYSSYPHSSGMKQEFYRTLDKSNSSSNMSSLYTNNRR
jgi:hypothetical protein